MPSHRTRASRVALNIVQLAGAGVLLWGLLAGLVQYNIAFLASLTIPTLAISFGFASLLYNRARALPAGKSRIRSLYAAERATQATVWALASILSGACLYGLFWYFGLFAVPRPSLLYLLLALFLVPYLFLQVAYHTFVYALWSIAPEFLRIVRPIELLRRVRDEPSQETPSK
jgi:hypothetical protein